MRLLPIVIALFAGSTATAGTVIAKDLKTGIGLGGGAMVNGLTAKQYLSEDFAVQAHLGAVGLGLAVGADAILPQAKLWEGPGATIHWGYGAGAGVWFYNVGIYGRGQLLDISGIVEATLRLKKYPIEFSADFRPGFLLGLGAYSGTAYSGFHIDAGGGAVRWFF